MAVPRGNLQSMLPALFTGAGGKMMTPEEIARQRQMAAALMQQDKPITHWAEGVASLAEAFASRRKEGRADEAEKANAAESQRIMQSLLGGMGGPPASSSGGAGLGMAALPAAAGGTTAAPNVPTDLKSGIIETASALGVDPVDLATTISYETAGTFDPMKAGPTTQWGQHKGLIQFGEPQAKKYGVDWNNPVGSQLGANGAVASYLRDTGVQPGMGLLDIYSAINAGGVGRYNRSDAGNGGAPGTVRDKVEQQMAGHRAKAMALLGTDASSGAATAIQQQAPIQIASADPSFMPGSVDGGVGVLSPEDQQRYNERIRGVMPTSVPYAGPGAETGGQMSVYDDKGIRMENAGTYGRPAAPLRPFNAGETRPNADGSYSTEISTTWQLPTGEWVNVPSLWMAPDGPKEFDPSDEEGILGAMSAFEAQNGQTFSRFASPQEAEQAAVSRSSAGGAGAGALPPPRTVGANPVPPADPAQRIAQQMAQADPSFDGFARDGGNVQGAPAAPPVPGAAQPAQAMGGINPAIMEALSSPYADAQTKQIAGMLLNQQMEQQAAAQDPMRAMQLQKGQLEIDALRNPRPDPSQQLAREKFQWEQQQAGVTKPTADIQEYQYAKQEGYEGTFADYQLSQRRAGATSITNTVGGESGDFYKEADKNRGKAVADIAAAGDTAQRSLIQIGELEGRLKQVGTGAGASIRSIAGSFGIPVEGVDDIQAATALINQLVPGQRPPGSGTMSDADVELFKQSLPRIINSPDGNAKIIGAMKGIAEYDAQRGQIANAVLNREISPAEGQARMNALPNPLQGLNKDTPPAPPPAAPGAPQPGTIEDGHQFKGGDPADPANWEPVT